MIVYGSRSVAVDVAAFLRTCTARAAALPSPASRDALVDLLVDFGEVESAVADACLPDRDEDDPQLAPWYTAGQLIADALCATDAGDRRRTDAAVLQLAAALDALRGATVPATVDAKTAEGFAQYALFPDSYAHAAECVAETLTPPRVACVGIRSIGAPLAHVVAAALSRRNVDAEVRTVRPRGHPFDRRLIFGDTMRDWVRQRADAVFAVVDEGPGLSGTSFAAAVDALIACGVEDDRIVLMPSWDAPAERLRSERARNRWRSHRRFVAFDRRACPGDDISAGAWRRALIPAETAWPAVQPQHERRKIRHHGAPETVSRFAGLGRTGRAKLKRAQLLADAEAGPTPRGLVNGFLELEWIPGVPLVDTAVQQRDVLQQAAGYTALTERSFGCGIADDPDELRAMMHVNLREGVDAPLADSLLAFADRTRVDAGERVAVDGRMLPHEWIASGDRIFKTDALDHHADDFFPGSRDIAWDVAGAIAEFMLDDDAAAAFVSAFVAAGGDATVRNRCPFFLVAYLAYRLGYATLAAETLGDSPDGRRFTALAERYRRSLAARAALHR